MENYSRLHQAKSAKGFAMIEALISFVIMAVGLLALISFHNTSQRNISEAKTQAEAVALAEQKLQELESFLSGTDPRLTDGTGEEDLDGVIASFTRSWAIATDGADSTQKNAQVTVTWQDRDDNTQSVVLSSDIYFRHPADTAQDFILALNEVRVAGTGADYVWGPVDGGGADSGDQGEGDDAGGDGAGGDDTTDPTDPTDPANILLRTISISGSVDLGNGARFEGVSASDSNYAVTCTHSDSSYSCLSVAFLETESLTVRLTFHTNKTVCTPSSGYYQINNLSHDLSSGFDVVIRNRSRDC